MLKIPRALVVCVRGQGETTSLGGLGFEHQVGYVEFWLKFIGVADVKCITVEHTWDGRAQDMIHEGKAQAAKLAEQRSRKFLLAASRKKSSRRICTSPSSMALSLASGKNVCSNW